MWGSDPGHDRGGGVVKAEAGHGLVVVSGQRSIHLPERSSMTVGWSVRMAWAVEGWPGRSLAETKPAQRRRWLKAQRVAAGWLAGLVGGFRRPGRGCVGSAWWIQGDASGGDDPLPPLSAFGRVGASDLVGHVGVRRARTGHEIAGGASCWVDRSPSVAAAQAAI